MAYGNYAPFYRGGYFNPMQTTSMPIMADNQNQFTQPYQQLIQQPIQQPQIPPVQTVNDMIWVLNENEATSYPVAPNNTVTLWDKNNPTIYIKSVNNQGVPSMRILDFVERTAEAVKTPLEHVCSCPDKFVKVEDFAALQAKFDDLTARFNSFSAKPAKTAKGDEE